MVSKVPCGQYKQQQFALGSARIKPYHDFSMVFGWEVQARQRNTGNWIYLERFKYPQETTVFRNAINVAW